MNTDSLSMIAAALMAELQQLNGSHQQALTCQDAQLSSAAKRGARCCAAGAWLHAGGVAQP